MKLNWGKMLGVKVKKLLYNHTTLLEKAEFNKILLN